MDQYHYTGEVDQDGRVCGEGVAINIKYPSIKLEMTCLNGK